MSASAMIERAELPVQRNSTVWIFSFIVLTRTSHAARATRGISSRAANGNTSLLRGLAPDAQPYGVCTKTERIKYLRVQMICQCAPIVRRRTRRKNVHKRDEPFLAEQPPQVAQQIVVANKRRRAARR